MYLFEFEYEFDKDDLSYIWQNLAPRNYKKITKQFQSVAHALGPTELLTMENICDNENLRWMVFKVKQRSQVHYTDLTTSQLGESAKDLFTFDDDAQEYEVSYNWPYDYLSFVEAIKMDVDVLYRDPTPNVDEHMPTNIDAETLNVQAAEMDPEVLSARSDSRGQRTDRRSTSNRASRGMNRRQTRNGSNRGSRNTNKQAKTTRNRGGNNRGGGGY